MEWDGLPAGQVGPSDARAVVGEVRKGQPAATWRVGPALDASAAPKAARVAARVFPAGASSRVQIRAAPILVVPIHWAARREAAYFPAAVGFGPAASVSERAAGPAAWEVCVAAAERAAASAGRPGRAAAAANLAGEGAVCAELAGRADDSPPSAEALAARGRGVQSLAARRAPAPRRPPEKAVEARAGDRRQ
ncbi:hypothetical protein MNVI_00370 [Mycobacterium noviomagense]|uniref:Uncharacterized protein n=1 Tax=Mycobacterium noviomagense TaxID=459858 RepID=A0A7I7P7T6_9MYCO|nr:hypothetical protein MNVI_00370 [Mycobacterium noviomagense]